MFYALCISVALSLSLALSGTIVEHKSIKAIKQYIPAHIPQKDILIVMDLDNTIGMSVPDGITSLKLKPLEPCTVDFIREIQHNGTPIIVLTARKTYKQALTHKQIAGIGLDFSKSFPLQAHTIQKSSTLPIPYQDGIILASNQNKGMVLKTFLTHNNIRPKKIIFVDDKLENVKAVDKAAKEMAINCTSIHFTLIKNNGIAQKIKNSLKSLFGGSV